jgi:hypothetical protein
MKSMRCDAIRLKSEIQSEGFHQLVWPKICEFVEELLRIYENLFMPILDLIDMTAQDSAFDKELAEDWLNQRIIEQIQLVQTNLSQERILSEMDYLIPKASMPTTEPIIKHQPEYLGGPLDITSQKMILKMIELQTQEIESLKLYLQPIQESVRFEMRFLSEYEATVEPEHETKDELQDLSQSKLSANSQLEVTAVAPVSQQADCWQIPPNRPTDSPEIFTSRITGIHDQSSVVISERYDFNDTIHSMQIPQTQNFFSGGS